MSEIKTTVLIEFWRQTCQYQYRYHRDVSSAIYVNMIQAADYIKDCTVDVDKVLLGVEMVYWHETDCYWYGTLKFSKI
jgi:hypothetical protein